MSTRTAERRSFMVLETVRETWETKKAQPTNDSEQGLLRGHPSSWHFFFSVIAGHVSRYLLTLVETSLLTSSMLVKNHLPLRIDKLVKPQGSFPSTRSPFLMENRNPDS
jgi:hypothetical protein